MMEEANHRRGRSSQIQQLMNFWKDKELSEVRDVPSDVPTTPSEVVRKARGESIANRVPVVIDDDDDDDDDNKYDDDDDGDEEVVNTNDAVEEEAKKKKKKKKNKQSAESIQADVNDDEEVKATVKKLKSVTATSELTAAALIVDSLAKGNDKSVVKAALKAAATFCTGTEEMKKRLLSLDGAMSVAMALVKHVEKKSSCLNGLNALFQLSQLPDAVEQLRQPKVLRALVSVLEAHEDSAKVQVVAYRLIITVATGNSKVQNMVSALGGVDVIFSGLRQHREVSSVQMWGFASVAALITQPKHAENRSAVVNLGGVELIIAAMATHKKWAGVLHFGLFTLRALSSKSTEIQNEIFERGGIECVYDCINSAHPNIQKEALLATVGIIDRNAQCKQKVLDLGIVDIFATLLKECELAENLGVCVLAAATLAQDDIEAQNRLRQKGILKRVFKLLRKYSHEPVVVQWSCAFISAFSVENVEVQKKLDEYNALEVVLKAINNHVKNDAVVAEGLGCLAALASCNLEKKEQLDSLGGIITVIQCMKSLPKSVDVQARGCAALGVISRGNVNIQNKIAASGGIAVIYKALVKMPDDLDVQRSGFGALLLLASGHENNRAAMDVLDVEDLAREAVAKHNDATVTREAQMLLDTFSQ